MLKHYIRFHDKFVGTVVALDKDRIGVAIQHPRERIDKKRGTEIAIERAEKGEDPVYKDRNVSTTIKVPKSEQLLVSLGFQEIVCREKLSSLIQKSVEFMQKRANRYFKEGYCGQ